MKSVRLNAAVEMGCLEHPDCQAAHLRRSVPGLACFGPSASQSSTNQTAYNQQVGVQGGSGNTSVVGAGTTGTVAAGGGIAINDSGNKSNSATTINVTTNDAANDALAFSTIDHLITQETAATESMGSGGVTQPAAASPVIITTGSNSGPDQSQAGLSTDTSGLANLAIIAGGVLALVAFIHSKGKAA